VPITYLYNPFYYLVTTGEVKGIKPGKIVYESDRFWDVADWYIASDKIVIDE
jgi:hypothetical protein